MKRYILTIFAALAAVVATAWPVEQEAAFRDGESLSYQVSYKAALVPNTVVADIRINTTLTSLDGTPAYHIWGNGRVMSFFRWFFDLNDTYEVWLEEKNLLPIRFQNDLKEGKYKYKSHYLYDWDAMKVTTVERNAKWDEDVTREKELTVGSMDPFSIFFNLRSHDITSLHEKQDSLLTIIMAKKTEKIMFRFLGREVKNIRKVGKFNSLKFSCQLTNDDGDSFPDGSEFYVWVTDDRNKVPIYLESPIKVGSVQAFITKMENLKYPLDSKIK